MDVLNFVSKIVVCVGVNDRRESTAATLVKVRSICSWSTRANKAVLFMGIPPFPNLPQEERDNITHINAQAKDVFGDRFIEPIEEECIVTVGNDPVHYTPDTAHMVMGRLAHRLN